MRIWSPALAILIAASVAMPAVAATTVYRSVDAEGNVTYSMSPPDKAVETKRMDVRTAKPDPAAQDRLKASREALDRSTEKRLAQERSLREANAELARAKKVLEDAREVSDEDWAGTYGPYRRLKPGYYARVHEAEAALNQAERAVREHCRNEECPGTEAPTVNDTAPTFSAAGGVRHGENRQIVVDAEGRAIDVSDGERHSVQEAESRHSELRAHEQHAVWDADSRSIGHAEERHEVD